MAYSIILILCFLLPASSHLETERGSELGRRLLMSFKETPEGLNITYDCSPSGPCIPCLYAEKNDGKYRCSETGYRIPLRCEESKAVSKEKVSNKESGAVKQRSLLDNKSASKGGADSYITYRSCIPATNEEKISVLGFEGIMLFLLILSGSFVYFRRKGNVYVSGAVRVPTSSRF
ncbi:hypothetical protein ACET3Z_030283 [Daucus carota]